MTQGSGVFSLMYIIQIDSVKDRHDSKTKHKYFAEIRDDKTWQKKKKKKKAIGNSRDKLTKDNVRAK